jgi:hypothetical protein
MDRFSSDGTIGGMWHSEDNVMLRSEFLTELQPGVELPQDRQRSLDSDGQQEHT